MGILEKILSFFFPPHCILCGKVVSADEVMLCDAHLVCGDSFLRQAFALKTEAGSRKLRCMAPAEYTGDLRKVLHRFKFKGETSLAKPLAKYMSSCINAADFDCSVPVPISENRMKERGYNQSALLGKALSKMTGIPTAAYLKKVRNNMTQHTLSKFEREKNVQGVYSAEECSGMRVLLVDDIITTGATVKECARTLLAAGAAEVTAISCALVPAGSDSTQ